MLLRVSTDWDEIYYFISPVVRMNVSWLNLIQNTTCSQVIHLSELATSCMSQNIKTGLATLTIRMKPVAAISSPTADIAHEIGGGDCFHKFGYAIVVQQN